MKTNTIEENEVKIEKPADLLKDNAATCFSTLTRRELGILFLNVL
jgi:hypothetical protein